MNIITGRNSRVIGNAVEALLLVYAAAAPAMAGGWEISIVPRSFGGDYSSLQFDKFGNGHVCYTGGPKSALQYSFWDHNLKKWFTTALDSSEGFCSLALDASQSPHISYPRDGKLEYAYWDGSAWQKQEIALPTKLLAFYTSLALDRHDRPSISYYEVNGPTGEQVARFRVVSWNGKYWELTTADATYGSGKFNSIAYDSAGRLHVAYADVIYENSSMRYAYWDGTRWNNEILEGAGVPGTYRQAVRMVLDKYDNPHISFSDLNHQIVKYATKRNGKWQIEDVDSIGQVAYPDRNGIALDEEGTPYISYFDQKAGILKVAHRKDNKWLTEIVDSGFAGFTSSIQISNGLIWVTYSPGNGDGLKFARRPIQSLDTQAGTRNGLVSLGADSVNDAGTSVHKENVK